uniref:Tectonic family member 1 n=1 Tax=Sinocyclocheilus anshuiensis TaxID=1608454 RepID=A0A671T839_9TELE
AFCLIPEVIGVEVAAITLQSLEGTQTPVDPADLESYIPVLLESGDVCNNVVLQVKYTFRFSEAGEILNAIASVLLGAIKSITVPIQQEFQITFLQDISSTPVLQFSGNPGYVVGRPLVAGTRTADGIVQSANPTGSLTILQNSGDQDCLSGSSRRSPVLFGIDMVSGCTLKLSDGVNCSLVSEVILWALKGQSFPDHVASFGNSLPQNPLDWVTIQNQTIALGTQACSIPLSYHLEVKWTKYGTLVNPQAQIVSVMETIITNTSSLALLISADGLLSVTSSVSFVDVSASASSGFKAPPTIDAKLPFDFFFPFV